MKQKINIDRRNFLKKSAFAAAAFTIVPRHVLGGAGYMAPSDVLTKAIIGCGGICNGNHLGREGRLVALCDVDRQRLESTLAKVDNSVKAYHDFRELLQQSDIDIVHIATPPHWHGIMSKMAAEAGKDIWCEKPMTRTIGEGKSVVSRPFSGQEGCSPEYLVQVQR